MIRFWLTSFSLLCCTQARSKKLEEENSICKQQLLEVQSSPHHLRQQPAADSVVKYECNNEMMNRMCDNLQER